MSFTTAHFIEPEQVHNHVTLYSTVGLSLGAVIILLFILGAMLHKPTATRPAGIVPALINDRQQLNAALKAYDNSGATNTTNTDAAVKQGLNQNSQDVSQFSQ